MPSARSTSACRRLGRPIDDDAVGVLGIVGLAEPRGAERPSGFVVAAHRLKDQPPETVEPCPRGIDRDVGVELPERGVEAIAFQVQGRQDRVGLQGRLRIAVLCLRTELALALANRVLPPRERGRHRLHVSRELRAFVAEHARQRLIQPDDGCQELIALCVRRRRGQQQHQYRRCNDAVGPPGGDWHGLRGQRANGTCFTTPLPSRMVTI